MIARAVAIALTCVHGVAAQDAAGFAADRNFDARLRRPGWDRFAFAATEGSGALACGEHELLFAVDYAANVARLGSSPNRLDLAGGTDLPLIEHAVHGVLGAQLGLLPHGRAGLSLGAALPLAVLEGPVRVIDGSYNAARAPLQSQGVGAPALLLKWAPLSARRAGFGLALLAQLDVGTGGSLRSDPGVALWPRLAVDALGPAGALALNLGYRVVTGKGPLLDGGGARRTRYGDQLTLAASARAQLWGPLQAGLAFNAAQLSDAWAVEDALASELLAALRVELGASAVVQLGGGLGLSSGFSEADGRVFTSVALGGAPQDGDGDGLSGDADACPAQAEDFDLVQDHDGCPDLDDDADGVPDARDACPRDPAGPRMGGAPAALPMGREGRVPFPVMDVDGCPRRALGDRDGDGVDDLQDACPSVPGPARGCPGATR